MSDWTPPPTTRWCLVGEPDAAVGGRLYVLHEHGLGDDPPCGVEEPDRGNYLSSDPADHPPEWLSPFGIGTTSARDGAGIAGFVWYLTMECDRDRVRRAPKKAKARKPSKPADPTLFEDAA